MNPFDPKSVLLAKHAQHVVLIHFPIALFVAGVTFDLLAVWKQSRGLATAVYYNLTAAAISTVPAAATGVLAWQWQLEGKHLKGVLLLHLILGLASTTLDLAGLVVALSDSSPAGVQPARISPPHRAPEPAIGRFDGSHRRLSERRQQSRLKYSPDLRRNDFATERN
jgi:uncharacterized membrane protein